MASALAYGSGLRVSGTQQAPQQEHREGSSPLKAPISAGVCAWLQGRVGLARSLG